MYIKEKLMKYLFDNEQIYILIMYIEFLPSKMYFFLFS